MIVSSVDAQFICENNKKHDKCSKPLHIVDNSLTACINEAIENGWKITEGHKVYCPYCKRNGIE
jgi:hypothetical protein